MGVDPQKPFTFEIAAGLLNFQSAVSTNLQRGSGINALHGPRQVEPLRRRAISALVLLERLGDLPSDAQHRVERSHRLLEHHADIAAADGAHLGLGKSAQVASVEEDLAGDDAARRIGDEAQDRQRADRLA